MSGLTCQGCAVIFPAIVRLARLPTIALALCFCLPVSGTEIHVPLDQPTIQQGIIAATNGDTVLVAPGTYHEALNFLGKDIVVASESGPEVTIVNSHRTNRVVSIVGSPGRTTRLQGFTLRNGSGGLYLSGASVTIVGNIIVSNATCTGAGIDIEFCSPLIISNIIAGNFLTGCSGGNGGGIYVGGAAAAEIVHNVITNNSTTGYGGGIELFAAGTPSIRQNLIGWNSARSGGGIDMANYADAYIVNNVIVSNVATTSGGGGINSLVPSGRRGPYVINNTIVDNRAGNGSGIFADGFDKDALYANNIIVGFSNQTAFYVGNFNDANQPIIRFNDLFSPLGQTFGGIGANPVGTNGNISTDPLFLNAPLKDYRLSSGSGAIEAGYNSDAPTNDFDGALRPYDAEPDGKAVVDMGAYEWRPHRAKLLPLTMNAQQPLLTWISSGGVRYRVQYSDAGLTGAFVDVVRSAGEETDLGPNGVPGVMSWLDANPGPASRYYRIKTLSQ
jgi:hypothetical protein